MDARTKFVELLSAQIVEWDNQLEALKDKAESARAEEKSEYAETIAALQRKRDEAVKKLMGIGAATDDEWEDLKAGAEQIWSEVKDIFRDAIEKP
jgi:seryl-tRNA synthetase